MSSGGSSIPPPPSTPVSPILAKWPIGYFEPEAGKRVHVFPDLQFLKAYQQLWSSIQGSGGTIDIVDLLFSIATAPPFEYSSPQAEALIAQILARQTPQDQALPEYLPYIPQDPAAASQPYTPTITFATPGDLSVAYTAQEGEFTLIGNLVCFNTRVAFTPTFTTSAGAIRISLPTTAGANITSVPLAADPGNVGWPAARTQVGGAIAASTAYATLNGIGTGVAASALGAAHYLTAVAYTITIQGCYFKA